MSREMCPEPECLFGPQHDGPHSPELTPPDPVLVKLEEVLSKVTVLTAALEKVAKRFPLLGLKL